jgi:hypothetical protein
MPETTYKIYDSERKPVTLTNTLDGVVEIIRRLTPGPYHVFEGTPHPLGGSTPIREWKVIHGPNGKLTLIEDPS